MPRILAAIIVIFLLTQCHRDRGWQQELQERVSLDFSKTEVQVRQQLAKYYPVIPDSLMSSWEKTGHLEMRLIDGQKRYFKNAVSNLFRLDSAAAKVRQKMIGIQAEPLDSICLENSAAIIKTGSSGMPAETRRITIEYTLTVDADAVPAGGKVKCWLPFLRESQPRQQNVKLLSTSPSGMKRSAPEFLHSSLYSVQRALAGKPVVFSYVASFEISGQWVNPKLKTSRSVKISETELKRYTREEPPHVVFSPQVRQLADSLAAEAQNPQDQVKAWFYWIDRNIPWASALEYSIIDCIPDYVISQRHGDCGMKTFLLMSMARYKGIPARWQSGWMLHPGEENLHDWCEMWFEGNGWVPVDMSFGLQNSEDQNLKEFYLNGIDSYRMIVNDGFACEFDPAKTYIRSEPFDFQRGEVEYSEGNLYFNQWDYHLNVLSIEKKNR